MSRWDDMVPGFDEPGTDEPRAMCCAEDGPLGCDEPAEFESGLCRKHELRAAWALEAAVPEGEEEDPRHAHIWARLRAAERVPWDRIARQVLKKGERRTVSSQRRQANGSNA